MLRAINTAILRAASRANRPAVGVWRRRTVEASCEQVDFVRFASKIYFGDASRLDLLPGKGCAKVFVLALLLGARERRCKL